MQNCMFIKLNVQQEVLCMIFCNCTFIRTEGAISPSDILDQIIIIEHVKKIQNLVYYNEDKCDVRCTCALFEMRGILCRHAFVV